MSNSSKTKIDWRNDGLPFLASITYWLLLTILSMVANVVCLLLAPLAALQTVLTGSNHAPYWAYYLMTHDNPIDGDEGHLLRWPDNSKWGKFKRRTAWLWRNKAYRFDYEVLGLPIGMCLYHVGNPEVSSEGIEGWLFQWNEEYTWELYIVKRYPFNPKKCLRIRFGWKLDDTQVGKDSIMMIANSVGLWKTFREN